jgi:hypothetical protein
LKSVLLDLVAENTAGDPMSSTKWLNCRLCDVAKRLSALGHRVSRPVISRLLKQEGYRLRVNDKQLTGEAHPERDQQFTYLRQQRAKHQQAGQPCLSVDTKKKELIGNFKQAGRSWGAKAELVLVHDFAQDAIGRAVPYGIYDVTYNQGMVYVGQSSDTPEFAVDNVVRWCESELVKSYPQASELFIEADSGGSNGARSRVWKRDLQEKVADRYGLRVSVSHYPRGTSKWNPIEHRLFSEISKSWSGCPLRTYEVMADYINETKTRSGLRVKAHLVTKSYRKGIQVSDQEMASLSLEAHEICPQWNYTLHPRSHLMTLE